MTKLRHRIVLWSLVPFVTTTTPALSDHHAATGRRGMVATVQPLATDAGLGVLSAGGNAIDAAVTAALTLGVVDGHNSGIGGGCFILIRLADGQLIAIDGREMAPAAATRDMYLRDGRAVAELSQTGPLAVGVPGALAAYALALETCGDRSLAESLQPGIEHAEKGYAVDRVMARNLRGMAEIMARFPATKKALLKPDGSAYQEGEFLLQPDLGGTYRAIAAAGTDWFYQGPFAKAIAEMMREAGGILTADDMGNYRAVRREPVLSSYRGHQIVGFPPPSSGGIHVAQILNILEGFDLADLQQSHPHRTDHIIAEAMKLAFADRAHWLGDADFAKVPRGLIDKSYAAGLAAKIAADRASPVDAHGLPPAATEDLFGNKHTTHIAAADAMGNWVAITATVNTSFGSKMVVPGTGVVLNNEMDDFSAQPGVPNVFGLIGAENNAIEPGKRPLSSMSPTMVLDHGEPILTLGAAGGPKIITQVVLTIIRHLDFGMSLPDAVAAARFHHQWRPDLLQIESSVPETWRESMIQRGHELKPLKFVGVTQAIGWDAEAGQFTGVHDPRVPGKAAGY